MFLTSTWIRELRQHVCPMLCKPTGPARRKILRERQTEDTERKYLHGTQQTPNILPSWGREILRRTLRGTKNSLRSLQTNWKRETPTSEKWDSSRSLHCPGKRHATRGSPRCQTDNSAAVKAEEEKTTDSTWGRSEPRPAAAPELVRVGIHGVRGESTLPDYLFQTLVQTPCPGPTTRWEEIKRKLGGATSSKLTSRGYKLQGTYMDAGKPREPFSDPLTTNLPFPTHPVFSRPYNVSFKRKGVHFLKSSWGKGSGVHARATRTRNLGQQGHRCPLPTQQKPLVRRIKAVPIFPNKPMCSGAQ